MAINEPISKRVLSTKTVPDPENSKKIDIFVPFTVKSKNINSSE
jgi:hypothetical protein